MAGVDLGEHVLEVGPGPGLTTDVLRQHTGQVTAIEIDAALAASLRQRLDGTNVTVVEGDATNMAFDSEMFSGAVSFTMLHHLPSAARQDRLLAEVYRVLKPGAAFVGVDSKWSLGLQLFHVFATLVPVDPRTFRTRLEAAGFAGVDIEEAWRVFRFRALKVPSDEALQRTGNGQTDARR